MAETVVNSNRIVRKNSVSRQFPTSGAVKFSCNSAAAAAPPPPRPHPFPPPPTTTTSSSASPTINTNPTTTSYTN